MSDLVMRLHRAGGARAVDALNAVLPRGVSVQRVSGSGATATVKLARQRLQVGWAGEGWLSDVRRLIEQSPGLEVVAARRMSPGAIAQLQRAEIGWVDELGNAEIVAGTVIVSRAGREQQGVDATAKWTPAFLAVAEAVLSEIEPTVSATAAATGLSVGTCTNALRMMSGLGLLESDAARGRGAGRRVTDPHLLLSAYADAARSMASPTKITLGVSWRDAVDGVRSLFAPLLSMGVRWAATGAVAAALDAPLLTNVTSATL